MNRLTSMQTQSVFPLRSPKRRMKSAAIAPVLSFNSGGMANQDFLTPPFSDPALRSPDRTERTIHHTAAIPVPGSLPARQDFMIHITIDASCITQLRHLVIGTCGESVTFMRIQSAAHATKMKVWLCLSKSALDLIMNAVMRSLPSAEFGRITPA